MPTALRERNKKRLRQLRLDKRRKMFSGRLVDGIVSLAGAPTNRTWVRYPEDSAEETLAWGNVTRANVPVWVDKNKAGQNEIVGVEYVEGTIRWGNALETVGAAPVISELQPTSVGELGFLPGRISASPLGGTYVRVEAFEHTGGRYPTTDIDVGTEYPATDDAYGRIGLYLDPGTNTVTAFAGEEVFDRSDLTDADKLSVPDGMYPIGAVIVYDGNAISSANTFEDWRLHHSRKGVGSSSGVPDFGAQETVTISGGVLDISGATGRNIVVAAESGTADTIDVIVGLDDGEEAIFQADSGDTITFADSSDMLLYNSTDIALTGGQVLKLVGRGAGVVTQYVDEKGGTGGGNDLIPAFTPPVNGSYSWANQGSSSVSVTADRIFLDGQVGTNQPRVRYKAAPSTPYVVTAAIIPFLNENANTEVGICWYDTGSGKLTGAAISNGRLIVKIDFTLPSTFNAVAAINADSLLYCPCIWLRIADDGTDRTASYSADGYNFRVLYTGARTTFLTPDSVGFYVDARTSNAGVTLLSWEES